MINPLKKFINAIVDFFMVEGMETSVRNRQDPTAMTAKDLEEVQSALKKWQDARRYFENCDDPELIDYAIYDMESAKRRYALLVRNAKSAEYDSINVHNDISG